MNPAETLRNRQEKTYVQNARETAAMLMEHTREQVEAEQADRLSATAHLVRWIKGIKP